MLASIVTHFRRGEPRNTRNTRKWPTTAILPACRWKLYDVCPSAHAPGVFPLHAAAKPHMECGNLLPLFGLQPPASTPVRASPISELRSAISDTLRPHARNRNRLCISLCFLLFILFFVFVLASIVTHFRRGEPRNTRNTRKWPTTAILPACRWKLHDVCPSAHAPGVFPLHAAAKPPMECGNLFPLSGLQPPANTPVRAFPISQLRSAISDTLFVSSCSKSYSSLYFPLFPLLPPVHSLLRLHVGVNRDSLQKRRTTKYTKHTKVADNSDYSQPAGGSFTMSAPAHTPPGGFPPCTPRRSRLGVRECGGPGLTDSWRDAFYAAIAGAFSASKVSGER